MNTVVAEPAVREWLRATAVPVTESDAGLSALVERLGRARIVGLGESTRFSRETFGIRDRIFRALVTEHGFRALAVQDGARSGERLDRYVRTGAGDPRGVLAGAWRPWRTAQMAATLAWIRAFNQRHPDDQVAVFGVEPPAAEPADYDVVLDHVRRVAPERAPQVEAHLAPIRTAHRIDEHVQRHQGIHPGRPFAEHAADALAIVESLPTTPGTDTARAAMHLILRFHRTSVAATGFAADERDAADRIDDWQQRTGAKIAYWDGIAHTSGVALGVGASAFAGAGSHLRARHGAEYASVAIGFHHGDLGVAHAPAPRPDLMDAVLGTVDLPAFALDLSASAPEPVRAWLRSPAKLRVISGVYDPDEDEKAHITVPSPAEAFDALVFVRETTPVEWFPEFDGR
ncbi:erythromycin esterase family protein [Nocardia farcinica]|uniref:erythromycin esterase family protein n=1 Tax=Nocardia farcinica TaxID=37329 RepID=UPI001894AA7E|nr:erythromycin esterase family protein [Nocardia farcinica]MBF6068962.1 erythromycin esterase family protein [Nocardia farcinica]MBF6269053.1 erythromycin esterase family protein [Nocardia farcinica]MBF6291195.1 erythromycin esterase family protein [Nocardia farcinica]MBF6372038.1 erythromycin esterase family protein [Nocardia farcinica]MBF6378868.1 erythromycin esterase family protein [Nocardia farcinica]